MLNNYANFGIGSSSLDDLSCDIDTTNTINGKPMYYLIGQHNLLFDETNQIGFLGLVNCNNITVKNLEFNQNFEGMLLAGTTDSVVENCSFTDNDGHGIYTISSMGNVIRNCSFSNGFFDGIFLYESSDNTLENNTYGGSQIGVRLDSSTRNTLMGQAIDLCAVGISFDSSGGNIVRDANMSQCGVQVSGNNPAEYANDVDTSNMVNGKPIYYSVNETNHTIPPNAGQVILVSCDHCLVSNQNISDASISIELAYSSMNIIEHNTLTNNRVVAIDLDGADNNHNTITGNVIQGNNYGIDVDASHSNQIRENFLSDNGLVFSLTSSEFNVLSGNTIQNGYYGVYLDHSFDNCLEYNHIRNMSIFGQYLLSSNGNSLQGNQMINCSLMVYGNSLAEYLNDADTSNTINGKPLYYLVNQIDRIIPEDAGEVILINSTHCTMNNLKLDKGTTGITLAYSSNNTIQGNIIQSQTVTGIDLSSGNNNDNTIHGNIIQGNGYGVDIEFSAGNTLKRNTFMSNGNGILLYYALNTLIRRNTIAYNYLGIRTISAPENTIRWNNIFKNTLYGLDAEGCAVTARWNWWGSLRGPQVHGEGNGDRLSTIKHGSITYRPWLPFPVLFAGKIRLQNPVILNHMSKSQGSFSSETAQLTSDVSILCGLRQTPQEQPVTPKESMISRLLS
jgi:parallel beta-helix repeat protein